MPPIRIPVKPRPPVPPGSAALTVEEKLDILAAAIETIGRDVAELKSAVLAPPPPAEMPKDHWSLALAQTEEPAGLDQPLTSFDAVKVAEYAGRLDALRIPERFHLGVDFLTSRRAL